jgi:PAS domain S-box-containing protein
MSPANPFFLLFQIACKGFYSQTRIKQIDRVFLEGYILRQIKDAQEKSFRKTKLLLERRKAEEALMQSEQRFRSVLNNSLDVIYRLNLQTGRYEYMSPSCKTTLGFEAEELMAMSNEEVLSSVHPEDWDNVKTKLEQINKDGSGVAEYRFKGKDGKYSWWLNQMVITRDVNGKLLYRDGFVRNITESKNAQEALKLSEEKFSKAFRNSPVAITLTRLSDGKIVDVNDSGLELTGNTREESIGHTVYELRIWANPLERAEFMEKLKKSGLVTNQEILLQRKDGTRINALVSGALIEIENEKHLLSSVIDLTGLKKAEKEIADLARFPMENPAAVLRVDRQGIIMFANPPAQNFLKEWKTEIGARIPERIQSIVVTSMASNDRTEFEEKLGEEIFSFLITPIISESYANLYGRAITKRKKAEEKLREYAKNLEAIVEERTRKLESNALYVRSLIEASLDPLVTINSEGKITDVNNATEYATGFSREELIGSDFSNYFTEPEKAATGYTQVFTNGFVKDYPLAIKHKLGKVTEVLYNATTYRDAEGQVQGVFAAARDITQRRILEKKLQESERLAAIGATAGMVGHDIRNPLQAITSDVYLLHSELASLPEGETKKNMKESLDGISDNVEYVNKIVQDLQDYAKPINPITKEIRLDTLCEDVLFKSAFPDNVKALCEVDREVKRIVTDSEILKRILSNLVNNAFQAMPNGGKIVVHAYPESGTAVITVQDTGGGIPEDVKPMLFTPLFTTKSKGQGFGLAVVKRMTEALGGTVTFESKVGEGAKFIVSLPRKKAVD